MRPGVERVAASAERLAVLLGAGVSPTAAWGHLADSGDDARAAEIRGHIARGLSAADAIAAVGADAPARDVVDADRPGLGLHTRAARRSRGRSVRPGGRPRRRSRLGRGEAEGWRMLAAAWAVAEESGAPLGRCLADIAVALSSAGAVERDTAVALAGPKATARLVLVLPVVSTLGGSLLGLDGLGVLIGTPAGLMCAAGGVVLLVAARVWTGALTARARPATASQGLTLDLIAVGLGGGGSVEQARRSADRALERYRLHRPGRAATDRAQAERILALAARSGAAPGELLRREAGRMRRDAVAKAGSDAAALGVWLMLPLGLCVLPAFLLLAVAPAFIGVLGAVPMM